MAIRINKIILFALVVLMVIVPLGRARAGVKDFFKRIVEPVTDIVCGAGGKVAGAAAGTVAGGPAGGAIVGSVLEAGCQSLVDSFIDGVFIAARINLLNKMTNDIVTWIETGDKPRIITDWDGFLKGVANDAIGTAILASDLNFLCSPFRAQVEIILERPPRFSEQVACTLDQVVGNIENFYDDFRAGGFVAYQEMWQPQNNFYGSVLLAMQERDKRVAEATEASIFEGIAGQGFLGSKKCDTVGGRSVCRITTPGVTIGATLAKGLGSTFDLIANTEDDFAAYSAVIADALINRMLRAGAEGLLGVDLPPPAPAPETPDPCLGLVGDELALCLKADRTALLGIEFVKDTYISEMEQTLLPLLSAEEIIEDMMGAERFLLDRLVALEDCRFNKGLSISDVQLKRQQEISVFNQLESELATISPQINSLIKAVDDIANEGIDKNPVTGNLVVADIFFNIETQLNPETAVSFEGLKRAQADISLNEVNQRTISAQIEIAECFAVR